MFIVSELKQRPLLSDLGTPYKDGGWEGLGWQACTAGAVYDNVYVCVFKLEQPELVPGQPGPECKNLIFKKNEKQKREQLT